MEAAIPAAAPEEPTATEDLRPVVGKPVSNRSVWIFAGVAAIAAVLLFTALEARRADLVSPATNPSRDGTTGMIAPPPPLAMSSAGAVDAFGVPLAPTLPGFGPAPGAGIIPQVMPGVPTTPRVSQPGMIPGPPIARTPPFYDAGSPDPVFVPPQTPPALPAAPPAVDAAAQPGQLAGSRVGATRFANPALTVPQGTVIPAVLETALDSNRPGFVRAIVSRDVRSFDGTRVLIPRGSRLFGEYKTDVGQGQSRVFVQWQKLTRPDGVQIALDSPAADPLGRSGIGGKVNTHFWARFGNALLQSSLDIGVGLATRSAGGDTVVLGLPGSTQTLIQPQGAETYKPTITVKHGTSVSVFVARDLDFSTVE